MPRTLRELPTTHPKPKSSWLKADSTCPLANCTRHQKRAGAQRRTWQRLSAAAQGWEYTNHADFGSVLYEARRLTGNPRIHELRGVPNELHINYYKRKRHLNADAIGEDIETVAELLTLLSPLTGLEIRGLKKKIRPHLHLNPPPEGEVTF